MLEMLSSRGTQLKWRFSAYDGMSDSEGVGEVWVQRRTEIFVPEDVIGQVVSTCREPEADASRAERRSRIQMHIPLGVCRESFSAETGKHVRPWYLGAGAWTSPSAHGPPFPAANKKLGKCLVFHGRSFPYSRLWAE